MSKLRDIKKRATRIAARKTMDQEDARVERAKQEAREEAKRERTQQRVEQARETERERVLSDDSRGGIVSQIADTLDSAAGAVDDGDGQRLDDFQQALGTDFDGDGETLAEEFGLQSAARADREDDAFQSLNDRLDTLDREMADGGGSNGTGRGGGLGGDAPGLGGDGGGGFEPIGPEDFGFGGGDDDGGFFGGDGR